MGNVRVAFTDRNEDEIVEIIGEGNEVGQVMDFYPFGLQQRGEGLFGEVVGTNNRFRFNGIEHVEELGLDMAFYRSYDPAIGRWLQADPKAESFVTMSPYTGMGNNPVLITDPLGDSIPTTFYDADGNISNSVPDVIQQMFNKEYGISVAYNSSTGMLYQSGETETENTVSEPGKAVVEKALGEGVTSTKLIFGYSLGYESRDEKRSIEGGEHIGRPKSGVAVVDLADFDQNGGFLAGFGNESFNARSLNLGRTFEHEFFGHGLAGYRGGKYETKDNLSKNGAGGGGNVGYINRIFRIPAGIPVRQGYGAGHKGADVFMGGGVFTYKGNRTRKRKNMINVK